MAASSNKHFLIRLIENIVGNVYSYYDKQLTQELFPNTNSTLNFNPTNLQELILNKINLYRDPNLSLSTDVGLVFPPQRVPVPNPLLQAHSLSIPTIQDMSLLKPSLVNKTVQLLGSGSYGRVYGYTSPAPNGTDLVIKQISKNRVPLNSIQNEIKILEYLRQYCSRSILCYMGVYEDPTNYYIVTEYLKDFTTLSSFQTPNLRGQTTIIRNLIDGLTMIQQLGVCHRDIKPDNILIDPNTLNIKYIDFGFACYMNQCSSSSPPGTYQFAAPELMLPAYAKSLEFADFQMSDVYSLGLTIYAFIVGETYYVAYYNIFVKPELDLLRPDLADKIRTDRSYVSLISLVLVRTVSLDPRPLALDFFRPDLINPHIPLLERMLNKNPLYRSF